MQESKMDGTESYKDKIISPTYGVEITQKELDIIKEVQWDTIRFKALPCAILYGGLFYLATSKIAKQLGYVRGISAMIFGMFGWFGGIYIGGRQLDNRLMTECPDGNAAKILRAMKGKGEFPVIEGTDIPADPRNLKRLKSREERPTSNWNDPQNISRDSISQPNKIKTNKYGDVIAEG